MTIIKKKTIYKHNKKDRAVLFDAGGRGPAETRSSEEATGPGPMITACGGQWSLNPLRTVSGADTKNGSRKTLA